MTDTTSPGAPSGEPVPLPRPDVPNTRLSFEDAYKHGSYSAKALIAYGDARARAALRSATPKESTMQVTEEMVSRFLCWKLPEDFGPDCGITFKRTHSETGPWGPQKYEPTGTNLFTYDQARKMLEHVLSATPAAAPIATPAAAPSEFCWLVELFLPGGNSMGYYHTGLSDLMHHSRTTRNVYEAKRYSSKAQAEKAAGELFSKAGIWLAVEHGFDKSSATPAAPADAMPDGPTAQWEDPQVQVVYELLCSGEHPPKATPQEHWEGWIARRIVDALRASPATASPVAASPALPPKE